jgi:hypothetical protein
MKPPLTVEEHEKLAGLVRYSEVSNILDGRLRKNSKAYYRWWKFIRAVEGLRSALDSEFSSFHDPSPTESRGGRGPLAIKQTQRPASAQAWAAKMSLEHFLDACFLLVRMDIPA